MLDGGPHHWGEDAGLEWSTAADDDPQQLYDRYDDAVARAQQRFAAADLDTVVTRGTVDFSVRRILFDLLEEYGRHTGHADLLHASVDGEWSFIETLRHLVYASQAWVARGVLGRPAPWHPLALPWDQAPDMPGVPRDREVRPSLDEVLAVRAETQALVRGVLEDLTDARLDEERTAPDDGVWPRGNHNVRDCLSTTLNEEYEHRRYAERDLAGLDE